MVISKNITRELKTNKEGIEAIQELSNYFQKAFSEGWQPQHVDIEMTKYEGDKVVDSMSFENGHHSTRGTESVEQDSLLIIDSAHSYLEGCKVDYNELSINFRLMV